MKISGLGYFFETKPMVASISTSHFTLSRARPNLEKSSISEICPDLHKNFRDAGGYLYLQPVLSTYTLDIDKILSNFNGPVWAFK